MFGQFLLLFTAGFPMFGHVLAGIPGPPKTAGRFLRRRRKPLIVEPEKRLEFFQVDVFFLLVDMPKQRPASPLGAYERVFATHGVEIAAP
ncbi:hypothetical protein D3C78_1531520 [compost metagenome]